MCFLFLRIFIIFFMEWFDFWGVIIFDKEILLVIVFLVLVLLDFEMDFNFF